MVKQKDSGKAKTPSKGNSKIQQSDQTSKKKVQKQLSNTKSQNKKSSVSKKKNISKTRSIEEVLKQGIKFLNVNISDRKSKYSINKLKKQGQLITRQQLKKQSQIQEHKKQSQKENKLISINNQNNNDNQIEIEQEKQQDNKEEIKDITIQQPQIHKLNSYDQIKYQGLIDVVFCCDTTYSMNPYLVEVKTAIKQISQNIVQKVGFEGIDVKFGFVGYQDHYPQPAKYLTKILDLNTSENMQKLIEQEQCYGGGDNPEAVLDGLYDSINSISWRQQKGIPSLRYIYHICDAPPHGDIYSSGSYNFKKGCPCNITAKMVGEGLRDKLIKYRLIKTNECELEKMSLIFKGQFFENFQQYTLKEAPELNIKVSDMFQNEVMPQIINNNHLIRNLQDQEIKQQQKSTLQKFQQNFLDTRIMERFSNFLEQNNNNQFLLYILIFIVFLCFITRT